MFYSEGDIKTEGGWKIGPHLKISLEQISKYSLEPFPVTTPTISENVVVIGLKG